MTTRQQTMKSLIDQIVELDASGQIESFAFAIVQPDGIPIFGHANPSYSLMGAMEQAKLVMGSTMLRDTTDAPGFESEDLDH